MKKYIIGILSPTKINKKDPFDNSTRFVENYSKRVKELGCVPLGLLFPEGKFVREAADICDAFIITGGPDVESVGIDLVHYAIKNNKPLLGVCLGMQTMAGYEWIIKKLGKEMSYNDIDNFYKHSYENEFLGDISNHNDLDPFNINEIEKSKHDVFISKNSRLYRVFKKEKILMPSLHVQNVKSTLDLNYFKVTARASDDTIEGLEYIGDQFIVGVQFHPELEEKNLKLFEALINSIKSK